ncbi:MAG TPA: hypothetical protein DCE44_26400 [Verrucomicrobiales bacterium]|nr:hypothetical protein [Verrucomicrobiales bacterium]
MAELPGIRQNLNEPPLLLDAAGRTNEAMVGDAEVQVNRCWLKNHGREDQNSNLDHESRVTRLDALEICITGPLLALMRSNLKSQNTITP